jgi:heme A synthase
LRISARWFQITGILIVLQVVLGTLISNYSIEPISHEVLGFLVLFMAVATMAVAIFRKPSAKSPMAGSGLLVLLVALQLPLGFAMLESDSSLLLAAHVANTISIMLTAFVGFFMARRLEARIRV